MLGSPPELLRMESQFDNTRSGSVPRLAHPDRISMNPSARASVTITINGSASDRQLDIGLLNRSAEYGIATAKQIGVDALIDQSGSRPGGRSRQNGFGCAADLNGWRLYQRDGDAARRCCAQPPVLSSMSRTCDKHEIEYNDKRIRNGTTAKDADRTVSGDPVTHDDPTM